jgi:hypothetical protein
VERIRWKTLGVAAVAALLMFSGGPAHAGSTSTTDASGTDYEPGCVADATITPQAPNHWGNGNKCTVSTSDGTVTSVDLTNGTSGSALGLSFANGQLTATWHVAGPIPAPGSTNLAAADLPGIGLGATYYALFQNKSVQTNVPTNPAGGCTDVGVGNQVLDIHSSWKDGFHFFVAFNVGWDGAKWVQSVQLGEYVPDPDGGFVFNELGTNGGAGWQAANTYHPFSSTAAADNFFVSVSTAGITVTVPGILKTPDTVNCQEGFFKSVYAKAGDVIANAKALTTANEVVTLPVTVPLSITCGLPTSDLDCENDLTSVGGFGFFADTTDGNSTAGLANSNITGIAYSNGAAGRGVAMPLPDLLAGPRHLLGLDPIGVNPFPDTLGPGPTCRTPTFGGLLPTNPLFTPDTACHIDDDYIARGSVLPEFWDTSHGFTA